MGSNVFFSLTPPRPSVTPTPETPAPVSVGFEPYWGPCESGIYPNPSGSLSLPVLLAPLLTHSLTHAVPQTHGSWMTVLRNSISQKNKLQCQTVRSIKLLQPPPNSADEFTQTSFFQNNLPLKFQCYVFITTSLADFPAVVSIYLNSCSVISFLTIMQILLKAKPLSSSLLHGVSTRTLSGGQSFTLDISQVFCRICFIYTIRPCIFVFQLL